MMVSALALFAIPAMGQFTEAEANDTKAAANMFLNLVNGATITGNSTGSSTTVPGAGSADYFRISTAAAALGIYRHRMVLTTAGTAGHTGTIRGLTVSGGVGGTNTAGTASATSDATIQTSSTTTTPARFNQWYGFGKSEELYYRVTGGTTTTSDYVATLETTAITPVNLGLFQPGQWDFTTFDLAKSPSGTTFSYTDTEVYLYDSNFNTMGSWNNDDYFPLSGTHPFHSELHLNLAPGTYYLAISQFNLANSHIADPLFENGPNDSILDFPNGLVASSATITHGSPAVPVSLDFSITDSTGTYTFDAEKPGAYGVYWATFNVVPEPATIAVLGLGVLPLLRRRRK
jgi:hypothetical protein